MSWKINPRLGRYEGHDYPGVYGAGIVQFELDEMEVGVRAALALDDPDQAWWEVHMDELIKKAMEGPETSSIPADACTACSMGRCGQGPRDNSCSCCRSGHR